MNQWIKWGNWISSKGFLGQIVP